MSCVHLKKLFELCAKEELRIGGTDLVRLVCTQCGEQEVCPTMLMENFEAADPDEDAAVRSVGTTDQHKAETD